MTRNLSKNLQILLVMIPFLFVISCSWMGDRNYAATIRVTSYGIPHILAEDWGDLGFGYGYQFTSDNFCELAKHVVRVNGEMSKYFGRSNQNLASDALIKFFGKKSTIRVNGLLHADKRMVEVSEGYAAGYNHYLDNIPQGMHQSCINAEWLRPIDLYDVARMSVYITLLASFSDPRIANAVLALGIEEGNEQTALNLETFALSESMGSNSYALGSKVTQTGQAMLLGNPHYPWRGQRRFYQVHMTIPEEIDVMGISILGSPLINVGFTEKFAWTHTVSNANRFTLYELDLNDQDRKIYTYNQKRTNIKSFPIEIEVKESDDSISTETIELHFSRFGLLLDAGVLLGDESLTGWPNRDGKVFAIRDVAMDNQRIGTTIVGMLTAKSFDQFINTIRDNLGLSFINTIAVNDQGEAFYGDYSTVPYLTDQQLQDCQPSATGQLINRVSVNLMRNPLGIPVLAGNRSECNWIADPKSPQEGLIPGGQLASIRTNHYASNSNDSYWLANLENPMTGYLKVMGGEEYQVSLRTQLALLQIQERINGTDGLDDNPLFSLRNLQAVALAARNLAGEWFLDDLLTLCRVYPEELTNKASRACEVLAQWDKKTNIESIGNQVFYLFWQKAQRIANLHREPFDPKRPIDTPRGLNFDDSVVRSELIQSLDSAVQVFDENLIPLDAPWGEIHYEIRNGKKIPLFGGGFNAGNFSAMQAKLTKGEGWSEMITGNSYLQTVTWDEEGVVAEGILSYSQSSDPDNPHFQDQTELYSQKKWVKLPFKEKDILADPNLEIINIKTD
mgnify:FL=1